MVIKKAIEENYNEIYNLHQELQNCHHRLRNDLENASSYSDANMNEFLSLVKAENTLCLIVVNDQDNIIGYSISYLMKTRPSDRYVERIYAFIDSIYIMPEYRNHGYGTELIDTIKDHYKKININNIELYALGNNTSAINFYIKNGFLTQSLRMEITI